MNFMMNERPAISKLFSPKSRPLITQSDQRIKTLPDERTTTNRFSKYDHSYDQNQVIKDENIKQVLDTRLSLIEQLADSLKDNSSLEIRKILNSLQEIARTLKNVSRTEIELNKKTKMLDSVTLESINQKQSIQRLKEQQAQYKTGTLDFVKKLTLSQNDQQKLQKDLLQQRKLNEEYYRKIKHLEKRIEMMLEQNLQQNQDQLRSTLSELIKENEQLKRDLVKGAKDNDRLKELNQKLIVQNNRLSKKLDSLKTKRLGNPSDPERKEEPIKKNSYAFDPNQMPANLEFRMSNLDVEQKDILLDLFEHGSDVFSNHIMSLDSIQQRKELINLVSTQFTSSREFSEKINMIMSEFVTMASYKTIEHFLTHISKAFRQIFNTDIIQLWIIDGMTCRAQTYDQNGQKKVALLVEGAFCQLIFQDLGVRHPVKEKELLYVTQQEEVYGQNFLLIPLMMNHKKPVGILEVFINKNQIQNLPENMHIDSQYFGLLINMLSKSMIQWILDCDAQKKELCYRDLFYSNFHKLIKSKSKSEFDHLVFQAGLEIFHISQTQVIFVENNLFFKNDRPFDLECGCAHVVYKSRKAQIITEIGRHQNFDENVDISSIMPVFIGPIFSKHNDSEVVAILEFIIKKKPIHDSHPFGNHANIGFRMDSIDQDVQKFYEIVQSAYQIVF